jgi:hypothetical protein
MDLMRVAIGVGDFPAAAVGIYSNLQKGENSMKRAYNPESSIGGSQRQDVALTSRNDGISPLFDYFG